MTTAAKIDATEIAVDVDPVAVNVACSAETGVCADSQTIV